jgi:oxygen-dependent protoporphyrinogen oxidase
MARVVVFGGGLGGHTAAYRLARARQKVLVVEAGPRLGGQLHSLREHGYVIELGAEGFVARSEAVPKLAHAVGVGDSLVGQLTLRSLGYQAGALKELAPGEAGSLLGFQVARDDLGAGIRTFRKGMGELIDGLAQRLSSEVEIRTGFGVKQIERRAHGYELRTRDGVAVQGERLVIATSARAASELLAPVLGTGALDPEQAKTQSSVTVSLAYPRSAIAHPLDATGFVIATADQWHGARACTFTSSKFEGRAAEDRVSLRVFMRPDPRELKTLTDAAYGERAAEVVARVLGASGAPERSWVSRWPDALPIFDAGYQQAIAKLEVALKGSRIALAGSAFHGSGIDAAVRSAWSVDERL